MRVLHFSDTHLCEPLRAIPWRDWVCKRLFGGLNLLLGRSRAFADGEQKLEALAVLRKEQLIDLVLFTGDYTAMGTQGEFRLAREAVAPLMNAPLGYLNVPGNHDIYVPDVVRERRFEQSFGDTLSTDLPEYAVEQGLWPFVKLVEDQVAVVGINSARPNPQPWRSSGKIPAAQLGALASILGDRRVRDRFVFVVTHYAPCLEQGRADSWTHGLVNASEFLETCRPVERGAILCGHVHRRYLARPDSLGIPVLCAGSATAEGREGFWMFEVGDAGARATPGRWEQNRYVLRAEGSVAL